MSLIAVRALLIDAQERLAAVPGTTEAKARLLDAIRRLEAHAETATERYQARIRHDADRIRGEQP